MTLRGDSRARIGRRELGYRLLLVGFSIALTAVVVELGLRIARDENRFLPYHANTHLLNYPSEEITPGISGVSHFTTNSYGLRGRDPADERIKILTIGGSTTACFELDDSETWPHLVMEYLNEDAGVPDFAWVGNSGIPGKNSDHHLMHARYLLPQLPPLDFVIVYAGLNDVGKWLYTRDFDPDRLADPDNWNDRLAESFRVSSYTPRSWPLYKRLELWKRASVIKDRILSMLAQREAHEAAEGGFVMDAEFRWMEEARARSRERQKQFVYQAKLQTLPASLSSYARNLRRIVELVREAGAESVLVAQAMAHVEKMTEEERSMLWMGAMSEGEAYVEPRQFASLIEIHNEEMRKVARETSAFFIDLPAIVGGDPGLYYDGHHMNERGARVVARAIADQLREKASGRAEHKGRPRSRSTAVSRVQP